MGNKVIENSSDDITRTTKWLGKVGLIYPSDYGYAVDLNSCRENLKNYKDSSCKDSDWLNITWQLMMSPDSLNVSRVSHIGNSNQFTFTNGFNAEAVRPSMYLKKDLVIEKGTGTKDDSDVVG